MDESNQHKEIIERVESLRKEATSLYFEKLFRQKDELSLVVTGHLYVEYWLEWLIRCSILKPERLLDSMNLTFAQKLAVAESLGLLEKELARAARTLNNIRNHIAHRLEYQIPKKDLQLLASFTPNLPKEYQTLVRYIGSPKAELTLFCTYFAGYAAGVTFGLEDAKDRKLSDDGVQ